MSEWWERTEREILVRLKGRREGPYWDNFDERLLSDPVQAANGSIYNLRTAHMLFVDGFLSDAEFLVIRCLSLRNAIAQWLSNQLCIDVTEVPFPPPSPTQVRLSSGVWKSLTQSKPDTDVSRVYYRLTSPLVGGTLTRFLSLSVDNPLLVRLRRPVKLHLSVRGNDFEDSRVALFAVRGSNGFVYKIFRIAEDGHLSAQIMAWNDALGVRRDLASLNRVEYKRVYQTLFDMDAVGLRFSKPDENLEKLVAETAGPYVARALDR